MIADGLRYQYNLRLAKEHLREEKQEPKKLETLLTQYPRLRIWYTTKERLWEFYRAKTIKEAEQQLPGIIMTLLVAEDAELNIWGGTLRRYKKEMLN